MLDRLFDPINRAGAALDGRLEPARTVAIALLAFAVVLEIAALQIGITRFSPDSWSYFELSKTIFGPAFYQFNTFRSYFSHEYSASFPLGYPTLIAMASSVFGERPLLAVDINIAAAVATGWVLHKVGKQLQLPPVTGMAIIASVLLYPHYLDEVVSGRAVPTALLVFVCAGYLQLRGKPLAAGLVLGVSVLFRFDFLVYALLYQSIFLATHTKDYQAVAKMVAGFATGISPWVIYSLVHFGKPWISDNSWVALSALPAFVVDYPAAPLVSASQNPLAWLQRVLGNIQPLLKSIGNAALLMPVLLVFVLATAHNWRQVTIKRPLLLLVLVAAVSTAPYLLTGYFDARYFSLVFLGLCLLLACAVARVHQPRLLGMDLHGMSLLTLVPTLAIGLLALGKTVYQAPEVSRKLAVQARQIETLKACHQKTPQTIYIFIDDVGGFAPMYGGVSGMRTAFIASNYLRMSDAERQAFFNHLQPHVVISSMDQIEQCQTRMNP